jgi:hypothetical protein
MREKNEINIHKRSYNNASFDTIDGVHYQTVSNICLIYRRKGEVGRKGK